MTLKEALKECGTDLEYDKYSAIVKLTYPSGKKEYFAYEEFKSLPWVRNFYINKLEAMI